MWSISFVHKILYHFYFMGGKSTVLVENWSLVYSQCKFLKVEPLDVMCTRQLIKEIRKMFKNIYINKSISTYWLCCITVTCRESLVMSICFWCLYRITVQHPLPNQSECRKIYRYDGIYCESTYQKYVEICVSLASSSCI